MKNKFFKVLSLVVVMALMLSVASFAAEEPMITIGKAEGKRGDIVEIKVEVENNPGIVVAGVGVSYDNTALKLVEVVDGKIWGDSMHSPDLSSCPYVLAWFNAVSETDITENGLLATLKFEILDEAKPKEYPLILEFNAEDSDVLNFNLEKVEFSKINGSISVVGEPGEVYEEEQEPEIDLGEEDSEEEPEYTAEERAKDVICLKIDEDRAFAFGEMISIDENNSKVVPYIYNDRTLVPLRFVSETLGADVLWEDGWNYCYVNKGDKKIKITFNSADIEVNGEIVTYDAPIQVVEERTMVPIRFISETLGYHVHWNEPNKAVVITPLDNPWNKERQAEETLLTSILVTYLIF